VIREMGPEYHPFADRIDALARKYQFEEIVEFLARNAGEEK
jgi:hypothetical protein